MQKRIKSLTVLGLALLLVTPLGCAQEQSPTAPEASAEVQASLLGGVVGGVTDVVSGVTGTLVDVVNTLLEPLVCPARRSYTESEVIGRRGGTLRVGDHRLDIPPGALNERVRITGTAPRGNYAEVRFEPHGLRFERPVTLTLSYEYCRLGRGAKPPVIVYTDDDHNILEVLRTEVDRHRETVSGKTDHFSGYLLAE